MFALQMSLVCVALLAVGADKIEWKSYTSKEGKFTAEFPGEPKVEKSKDGRDNTKITTVVEIDKGALSYVISTTICPKNITKDDAGVLLRRVGSEFEKNIESRKDLELNGFPGVEVVYEREYHGGRTRVIHRCFIVKDRAYDVLVFVRPTKKEQAEAEKFFKSFQIEDKNDK